MADFQKFPFLHNPRAEKPYFYDWSDDLQAGDALEDFEVIDKRGILPISRKEASGNVQTWWVGIGARPGTYQLVVTITTTLGITLSHTLELEVGES